MYQFFPEPNLGRRAQLFEVWLRPLRPEQAVFGLKLALHEVGRMAEQGIPPEEFEATREYLAKNVFVLTKTQDQQLGYALDSDWYGIPEFTGYIRGELAKLTSDRVNEVIRRHLSPRNLQVVMIAANAGELRDRLLSDEPVTLTYDGEKPPDLLEEDAVVGARPLNLSADRIVVTPIDAVFR